MIPSIGRKDFGRRALSSIASGHSSCQPLAASKDNKNAHYRMARVDNLQCGRCFSSQRSRNETPKNRPKRSSSKSSFKRKIATLESYRIQIDEIISGLQQSGDTISQRSASSAVDDAKDVFEELVSAVENRELNPSGKHGKEISDLMARILQCYCEISHLSEEVSCFDLCQEALDALTVWNLNFQRPHYEHAIAVANAEKRWKESAYLFWKQIDPEAAFNPVKLSVSDPQGLIAIARLAQNEQSSVADLVFDAVIQMSMVSPRDQTTYVLAAGNALGQVGEWEAAVEYLDNSYTTGQLGAPLVSSVMQACLLCGKPQEALRIYENKLGDSEGPKSLAEEWQWGGDRDTADPVLRDLVMRAAWVRPGGSTLALELFHDSVDEGVTISEDALFGVLKACERDRDLDGSLAVLDCILENATRNDLIVRSCELVIEDRDTIGAGGNDTAALSSRWLPEMAGHLASVVRTCNAQSNFGTGLFYLRRTDLAMQVHSSSKHRENDVQLKPSVNSLLNAFAKFDDSDALVAPTMVALCGLRCYDAALQLCDNQSDASCGTFWIIREYAATELEHKGPSLIGNPWMSGSRHIDRLTTAIHSIREANGRPTKRERNQVVMGLAASMQSCTHAHQSDLSLRLLSYVSETLDENKKSKYGLDEFNWANLAMENDFLTAEIINALGWTDRLDEAAKLFHLVLAQQGSQLARWRLTCSAGVSTLVKMGRGDEAFKIFQELDKEALSADSCKEIGNYLFRQRDTNELGNLYNLAMKTGNLSEELSLLAMTAVSKSKIDNRVRVLRAMVDDNAKYIGMPREKWLKTRYWQIKRSLGFFHARLLMWWNDAETCHLDELDLAIAEFNARKSEGLKVRNDVVRVIANNARLFNASSVQADFRWTHVPRTTDSWQELLLKIREECRSTPIYYDADFIDSIVAAFRNLGANAECVEFVEDLLDRDVRVHKTTLSRALEAANEEQSIQLASDIRLLISDTQS